MLTAKDFSLGDDGTLDTVIVCNHCHEELRYNYASVCDSGDGTEEGYDDFIDWALDDAAEQHDCAKEA